MKKSVVLICLMLALLNTLAQNYLISFAGAGDTTVVSSVKVNNLTSGASLTLNEDNVLHLKPPVGIGNLDNNNGTLQIYPNPMKGQSILALTAPESGKAVLSVVDLSGKTVCQISTLLLRGSNSFRISGITQGMYFVKVSGKNYTSSVKLVSLNALGRDAKIEYVSSGMNNTGNPLKSTTAIIDMPYAEGDLLFYKGITGQYSTVVTDVPTGSKTTTFNFTACTDADNNNYSTVTIGAQTWMAENLNVGSRINGMQEQTNNGITEKYCYNDADSNCVIYGGLYQWDEAMQYVTIEGAQGICPAGWHVPTDSEWTILTDYLGGEVIAGGKLKETDTTHWNSPNTGATNESGFTALPGGYRYGSGAYYYMGYSGSWWSSTAYSSTDAWYRYLYYFYASVYRSGHYSETGGYSVRCLRDL
jgi:uncharacterized protein (TIGR02145 family)